MPVTGTTKNIGRVVRPGDPEWDAARRARSTS